MSANDPRVVVFDIGNVLLNWDPDGLYAAHLTDPAAREAFYAEVGLHAMNLEIDRGAPLHASVEAAAAAHPDRAALLRLWASDWESTLDGAIEGSVRILRDLQAQGIPCVALSNFGAETFVRAELLFPFLKAFDRRFISADLGLVKPDPAIYAVVEDGLGLSGGALFFTDDRAENIAAAAARGWHTHHFSDPEALRRALREAAFPV